MDSMSLRLSKLTVFLHLADLCLDLGLGGNGHSNGNFSFHLEHKDKMFVEFLFSSLLYLIDNHVHNILRLFDGSAIFSFPTSETKCHYW